MKYLLDVDTGIDDSLAIAHALGRVKDDLIGITTTFGNTTLRQATKNTLDLLYLLGSDIPVAMGAAHPETAEEWIVNDNLHRIHGLNGIGNVELTPSPKKPDPLAAPDFMIAKAKEYAEDLTLVCVGPLTNLAEAIRKDREAIGKTRIVIMGGALTIRGNATLFAEANIHNDPEAAKYVFESGVDFHMIGLDVTLQTMIYGEDIVSWKDIPTKKAEVLYEMASYYYSNEYEVVGGAMHDPLAFEAAVDPDIVTHWFDTCLTVDLSGPSRGRTIATKELVNAEKKTAHVALRVDKDLFLHRFINAVREVSR